MNEEERPKFDSWYVPFRDSYYKGGNLNDAAATYHVFVYYMLMCYLLAGY
jgi:hypothetical protein